MQGRTEIKLNEATVKAALEYYLNNKVFSASAKCSVISAVATNGYGSASNAEITVTVSPAGDDSTPDGVMAA